MEKERLFISEDKVTVDFDFLLSKCFCFAASIASLTEALPWHGAISSLARDGNSVALAVE